MPLSSPGDGRQSRLAGPPVRMQVCSLQLQLLLLALALGGPTLTPEASPLNSTTPTTTTTTMTPPARQVAKKCQYSRGEWSSCNAKGMQRRHLSLKESTAADDDKCEPRRTLRRECRPGCKYQRGQWMPECRGRWRFRLDTLIGPVGVGSGPFTAHTCAFQRRVMKDCKRVCHYERSGWSECDAAGQRARNLTLAYGDNSCRKRSSELARCARPQATQVEGAAAVSAG